MSIPVIPLSWLILGFISMLISFYFEGDKLWYWYFYIFAVIFMLFSCFFTVRAETSSDVEVDVQPVFENSAWYDTDTVDEVLETETFETETVETETVEPDTSDNIHFTDTAIDVLGNTLTENFNYDRFNSICLGLILIICLFIFMR